MSGPFYVPVLLLFNILSSFLISCIFVAWLVYINVYHDMSYDSFHSKVHEKILFNKKEGVLDCQLSALKGGSYTGSPYLLEILLF